MTDLTRSDLAAIADRLATRIQRLTGLPAEVADEVSVSAIPPLEVDGDGRIVLRDANGIERARVDARELDPYSVLG